MNAIQLPQFVANHHRCILSIIFLLATLFYLESFWTNIWVLYKRICDWFSVMERKILIGRPPRPESWYVAARPGDSHRNGRRCLLVSWCRFRSSSEPLKGVGKWEACAPVLCVQRIFGGRCLECADLRWWGFP